VAQTRRQPRRTSKPRTLADDPLQTHFAVLWYGVNGTGKTTDLAHMAKLGSVQYIRADRSVRRRPLAALGVPVENIWPIDTLDTEEIVDTVWKFAETLHQDPEAFAGVALDTVTELIARRMEQIVDAEWNKLTPGQQDLRKREDVTKRYFVDRDYWQPITQEMRRIVRHMVDLPCHVGITAQTRKDTDEDDGRVQVGPAVNPAFAGDLMAYMDFVVRTSSDGFWPGTDETIYVGYPRHIGKYMGKDREHVLPSRLVEPTFDRIVAYAQGTLTKDTDERQREYREVIARRRSKKKTDTKDEEDDD
jgi:hypothetical protein